MGGAIAYQLAFVQSPVQPANRVKFQPMATTSLRDVGIVAIGRRPFSDPNRPGPGLRQPRGILHDVSSRTGSRPERLVGEDRRSLIKKMRLIGIQNNCTKTQYFLIPQLWSPPWPLSQSKPPWNASLSINSPLPTVHRREPCWAGVSRSCPVNPASRSRPSAVSRPAASCSMSLAWPWRFAWRPRAWCSSPASHRGAA
ncbi:hypothetical protein D3C78_1355660 [compost metagenome]